MRAQDCKGLELRVEGLKCKVYGLGCKGSGFKVWGRGLAQELERASWPKHPSWYINFRKPVSETHPPKNCSGTVCVCLYICMCVRMCVHTISWTNEVVCRTEWWKPGPSSSSARAMAIRSEMFLGWQVWGFGVLVTRNPKP